MNLILCSCDIEKAGTYDNQKPTIKPRSGFHGSGLGVATVLQRGFFVGERVVMKSPPACMFYWADFRMSTDTFSVAEVGTYQRLLGSQWINGHLPTEISKLAKIAGVDPRNMKKMWASAVGKKFVLVPLESLTKNDTADAAKICPAGSAKVYVNLRLEEERRKQLQYRERQSDHAKLSYKKKVENL